MDAAANGASTTVYTPSEQYLNNAGQGGGQAAATGENSGAGSGSGSGSGSSSGGSSSGQGGTSTEFQISSVNINNSQATAGTIKTVAVDDLPAAVEAKVRAINVPAGASIKVKSSNSATAAALHSANFNNGLATVSEDFDAGDYYIFYNIGGSDVATGFTFRVTQDDSGGFETAG